MSKLEETVTNELKDIYEEEIGSDLSVETKKRLYDFKEPIPWTNRNYIVPDIFLPYFDLFIEVKGIMTIEQMTKINWIAKNSNKPYYLLQATEVDWIAPFHKSGSESKREKVESNFYFQLSEIVYFLNEPEGSTELPVLFCLNGLTLERIEKFLDYKIYEYNRIVCKDQYDDSVFDTAPKVDGMYLV